MKRLVAICLLISIVPSVVRAVDSMYYNGQTVVLPSDFLIDATNFVNEGTFTIEIPPDDIDANSLYFTTSSTLNYTNTGTMFGNGGFRFTFNPSYYVPPVPGVPFNDMSANFVNERNGPGGGTIVCSSLATNILLGLTTTLGLNFGGSAKFIASATNLVNTGSILLDNSSQTTLFTSFGTNNVFNSASINSLIKLTGENVDLRDGTIGFVSSGTFSNAYFGVSSLDYGVGTDTNADWIPGLDLTQNTAISSFYNTAFFTSFIMFLTNSTAYSFSVLTDPSNLVTRAVYFQDTSPSNVTKNVFFGGSVAGAGAAHIEWSAPFVDPLTGTRLTNYLYLSDLYIAVTTNTFILNGIPENYTFAQATTPLALGTPESPNTPVFNPVVVTNLYSYLNAELIPTLTGTNTIYGGSITNLSQRIEITAKRTLKLDRAHIAGPDYISIISTNNFEGNAGSLVSVPFADIRLGVTNGFLSISNLVLPVLQRWSGHIEAFTGRWNDVDPNTGITNDNRVLLVNSQVFPTTAPQIQNLFLHATNSLVIGDILNVTRSLWIDATSLTIATNGAGAWSSAGQLLLSQLNTVWSDALPRLQYLTNYGVISAKNLLNFAGNMTGPTSDRNAAIPYQYFANHGVITNQGSFIVAQRFVNDGRFQNNPSGNFELRSDCADLSNGSINTPVGNIGVTANSLSVSNAALSAGARLELSISNCISEGYTLFNQFGHVSLTNGPVNGGVTNGNLWTAGGALSLKVKPLTGDLLATTVTNIATNSIMVNQWAGEDRGLSPFGYVNNGAVGRLVLDGGAGGQFRFSPVNGNNALYVDRIEFLGATTNVDGQGNLTSITIDPGIKIYYAQAIAGGISIAEKLSGRNGGHFLWVSNYAGIFSATNLPYASDGKYHTLNQALVISPNIDSDGDFTVNANDSEPVPPSWVFDNSSVVVPPCGCSAISPSSGGSGGTGSTSESSLGGIDSASGDNVLSFPILPSVATASNLFVLAQGDYNGLFYESNGVVPGHSGSFSASVNSKGRVSGSLTLGVTSYTVSGNFNSSGALSLTNLKSGKNPARLNVGLQLARVAGGSQITGQVSDTNNTWTATLVADRAVNTPNGKFTFVIPGTENGGATTPEGHGFGNLSIIGNGKVQWNATLADGTVIQPHTSARRTISSQGLYPLYYAPYGGSGLLIGWIQFTNRNDSNFEGQVIWVKPSTNSGKYFKAGFTNETGVVGSTYAQPPVASTNGMLVLGGGNLSALETNVFTLNKKFQAPKHGGDQFNLTLSKPTGVFNGSVIAEGRTNAFKGVMLQSATNGYGFFLGTNESGQVWFNPAP